MGGEGNFPALLLMTRDEVKSLKKGDFVLFPANPMYSIYLHVGIFIKSDSSSQGNNTIALVERINKEIPYNKIARHSYWTDNLMKLSDLEQQYYKIMLG